MKRFLGAVILALGVWACSSSDDSAASDDLTGSDAAGNAATTDASSNVAMHEASSSSDQSVAPAVDTGTVSDAKTSVTDAPKIVDAGQVDAPMACVKYCSCMAKWCADKVFGSGCLVECAKQTNWDLECRANMCNLVEPQPNNDHCTHAFGMFQCTDN